MTSYAAQKGRALPADPQRQPLSPRAAALSESAEAQVAKNKAFVVEHMPDMIPFLRDLVAEGTVDGWRAVVRCTLLDGSSHE